MFRCMGFGVFFSSLFWALVAFDAAGDSDVADPAKAIWAPILMVLMPFVVLFAWLTAKGMLFGGSKLRQISVAFEMTNVYGLNRQASNVNAVISVAAEANTPF